jgi:hypothetical protein
MAEVIRDNWRVRPRELDSKEVYEELKARGIKVPKGDMDEILENFKKAGVINGLGYMHPTAVEQHGAMVIGSVNLELLDQLDFD